MNQKIIVSVVIAILVVGVGAYAYTNNSKKNATQLQTPVHSENDGHTMDEHMGTDKQTNADGQAMTHEAMTSTVSSHGAKLAGSRIALQNGSNLKPGVVTLAFKLYGLDADEFGVNDLNVAHEKLMHLILVRDDATNFQHVHPEFVDGRWTVQTTIPEQGSYNMYVDISPKEENQVILYTPLIIGGKTAQQQFPTISPNMTVAQDGITVHIASQNSLKTNEHTKLTFSLTKDGKPVTQIDPYLGAFGHVVVLRHNDAADYLHAHPLTEATPVNGQVEFEAEFPAKGIYTVYGQFQLAGKVTTFPITLSVDEDGQAPATEKSSEHTH